MKLSKSDKEEVSSTPISSLPLKLQRLISSLIEKRTSASDQISELEDAKRVYTEELTRVLRENNIITPLTGPGWRSQFKTRVTRSLSESKLIDHGVPIKVIQACIEEKESEPYLEIRKVKEEKEK